MTRFYLVDISRVFNRSADLRLHVGECRASYITPSAQKGQQKTQWHFFLDRRVFRRMVFLRTCGSREGVHNGGGISGSFRVVGTGHTRSTQASIPGDI
jgi:hypothetical protein